MQGLKLITSPTGREGEGRGGRSLKERGEGWEIPQRERGGVGDPSKERNPKRGILTCLSVSCQGMSETK